MKTLLALSLIGATAALSAQVVNPYNPVNDFNNQWFGLGYGTTGLFGSGSAQDPATFSNWGIHGYLRQNEYFNGNTPSDTNTVGVFDSTIPGSFNMTVNQAGWVQGADNGVGDFGGSYNQRGASLTGIANPHNGALGPQISGAFSDFQIPSNFQAVSNPAERQAGVLSSQPGLRGDTGYLSAFGRSLGSQGTVIGGVVQDEGRQGPYLERDINRTLFWTETGNVQTNGRYVLGVQFDVINQNSSDLADDRATLAIRKGGQWYVAAVLDTVNNVYLDPALPQVGDLNQSDLSAYAAPGQGAYTLYYDFKNYGNDNAMETRFVWYELAFDGDLGVDPTFVTDLGGYQFSLTLPDEFGTEDPTTENPVYVVFSREDLSDVDAWGVFMRYASGNRRLDNFFIVTAPGGGATSAQKRTHAKAQADALRAARWAHHVRTQQQQRAAQHRRNQQRN